MKKNIQFVLLTFMAVLLIASASETTSQGLKNDSLYFVEEYTDNGEIGNSEEFYIPTGGGHITVMLRTAKPIGITSVNIVIERDVAGIKEKVISEPFDVEASWDYIFFDKMFFKEPGKYKVSAVKKNGDVIASAYVRMLKEN